MRNQMNPDSASLAALNFMFMVANVIARVKSPSEVKSAVKMFTEPLLKIQSFSCGRRVKEKEKPTILMILSCHVMFYYHSPGRI